MKYLRTILLMTALSLCLAAPVSADVLLVDSMQSAPAVSTPRKGIRMEQVRQQFGNPQVEHPAVSVNGGPLHPPITRWDYAGYSVFFENDIVLHSVIHRAAAN